MAEKLQFTISSELKNIIGKELITDDFIAVFELVKNSYDAGATKVEIIFDHIKKERDAANARIFIVDNGEGMSKDDLEKKWLFVAYSWKKEQTKRTGSDDFRNKIEPKRIFAGAKGIGRFSCDKLGRRLTLYTRKQNEKVFHLLHMDWDRFERDPTEKFERINVEYQSRESLNIGPPVKGFDKGTILEISFLRSKWDRKRLLILKGHLQRLINPSQMSDQQEFKIYLEAEEYARTDARYGPDEDYKRVNGLIRNVVFEKLGIKTTQITCQLNDDGKKICTELVDKGEFIYRVEERNNYTPLKNINIKLFYLNRAAKTTFRKVMGMHAVQYGSVLFYKNGIKINPYGNEGDDWLGLDRRKTQGMRRCLGNRDLMGRIEVKGNEPYFSEVSSRDAGVVKTPEFETLKRLLMEKALARLEKYVVEGIAWDSETKPKDPKEIMSDTFKIVTKLVGQVEDQGRKIEFNKNLLEIYEEKQVERMPELIKNIETVKNLIESKEERAYLDLQVKSVKNAFTTLEKKQNKLEGELKQREREALFLRQAVGEDKKEILALQHQIGLSAEKVRKYLLKLKKKSVEGRSISALDLQDAISNVLLHVQMMLSITSFVTKAQFNLMTDDITQDLVQYIKQYVENVYIPRSQVDLEEENVTIKVECPNNAKFERSFNPFRFIVLIDNLIDNSIKAGARNIAIRISVPDEKTMELRVRDDGRGIEDGNLDKIFNFGFSTTGGSGIGLYHVKKIVEKYGTITVNNHLPKGVEFSIRVGR